MISSYMKSVFLFLCIISLWYTVLAETTTTNNYPSWYIELSEDIKINDEWKKIVNKLKNTLIYFCNRWYSSQKDLDLRLNTTAQPWEIKDICIIFGNNNPQKININLGFSSARKKENWVISCNTDQSWYNELWRNFLINHPEISSFDLLPGQKILKNFKIKIPQTQTWDIFWCTLVKVDKDVQKAETWKMFYIEVAKTNYMQINITWDIYKPWLIDSIKNNKQTLLKIIIWIIWLRLIISIIQHISKTKKQKKHHKKS